MSVYFDKKQTELLAFPTFKEINTRNIFNGHEKPASVFIILAGGLLIQLLYDQ